MADPLNVIIDISHHNANPDFVQAAAAGIVGVIHKATQGLSFKHSMYQINRQKALDAVLAWGIYNFGTYELNSQAAAMEKRSGPNECA